MSTPSATDGGTGGLLDAERARCSFDVDKLTSMMGQDTRKKQRQNARAIFKAHPAFKEPTHQEYMSYADQYKSQLEHAAEAIQLTRDNPSFMMQHMAGKIQMKDMFETNGIGIHFFMFLTFLKGNGTKEQHAKWLELAQEGKFMGCYAQTELGHGSNLRGIETTATFGAFLAPRWCSAWRSSRLCRSQEPELQITFQVENCENCECRKQGTGQKRGPTSTSRPTSSSSTRPSYRLQTIL